MHIDPVRALDSIERRVGTGKTHAHKPLLDASRAEDAESPHFNCHIQTRAHAGFLHTQCFGELQVRIEAEERKVMACIVSCSSATVADQNPES